MEKDLNFQLSRCRVTIERAFGLLKGRWHVLMNCIDVSPVKASVVLTVCCVLHNILQNNGEDKRDMVGDTETCDNTPFQETQASDEVLHTTLATYVQSRLDI